MPQFKSTVSVMSSSGLVEGRGEVIFGLGLGSFCDFLIMPCRQLPVLLRSVATHSSGGPERQFLSEATWAGTQ